MTPSHHAGEAVTCGGCGKNIPARDISFIRQDNQPDGTTVTQFFCSGCFEEKEWLGHGKKKG